jgi:hypothetical protein
MPSHHGTVRRRAGCWGPINLTAVERFAPTALWIDLTICRVNHGGAGPKTLRPRKPELQARCLFLVPGGVFFAQLYVYGALGRHHVDGEAAVPQGHTQGQFGAPF